MDRRRFLGSTLAALAATSLPLRPLRRAQPATVPIAFWVCHRREDGWLVTTYLGTFRLPVGVDPELGKLYIECLKATAKATAERGADEEMVVFKLALIARYQIEPMSIEAARRLPGSQQWWSGQVPAHLRGRDDPLSILPARRDGVA